MITGKHVLPLYEPNKPGRHRKYEISRERGGGMHGSPENDYMHIYSLHFPGALFEENTHVLIREEKGDIS